QWPGFSNSCKDGLDAEALEALLEARDATTAVHQLARAAGPGGMGLGVDVELQRVAFLAPGRTGLVGGAVGHDHVDGVVVRVNIGLHGRPQIKRAPWRPESRNWCWRLPTAALPLPQGHNGVYASLILPRHLRRP